MRPTQVSAATSHLFGSFLAKAESEPDLEVCVQTRAKDKLFKDNVSSLQHKQTNTMFSGLWAGGQHWPGLGLPMKLLSSFHSAAEPWYFPIVMRKLGPKSLEHWIWAPQSWVIPVVKYLFSMFLFCLSKSNFTFNFEETLLFHNVFMIEGKL